MHCRFKKKLMKKNQTQEQQKLALHAISIDFDIESADEDKKIPLKNNKGILSRKNDLKSTKADWGPICRAFNAQSKLRHYSPETFQSYRGGSGIS